MKTSPNSRAVPVKIEDLTQKAHNKPATYQAICRTVGSKTQIHASGYLLDALSAIADHHRPEMTKAEALVVLAAFNGISHYDVPFDYFPDYVGSNVYHSNTTRHEKLAKRIRCMQPVEALSLYVSAILWWENRSAKIIDATEEATIDLELAPLFKIVAN
jgi:hypothetical protein